MTDHKVISFGSFTEDEIKVLCGVPATNDSELLFGSLDSETLRSVGIISTKPGVFEYSKLSQPLKFVRHGTDNKSIHPVDNTLPSAPITVSVDETSSKSSSGSYTRADLSKLPTDESRNITSSQHNSYSSHHSSGKHHLKETAANGVLNGHVSTTKHLLPRGLINLGNLCFLNATLQALLACTPFVQLLQELRHRDIPEIGYPTLRAFVEFISQFDMPTDSSARRRELEVLEAGQPFRPLMFESALKSFTPDVSNSLSGRPRQEDAQEFLSFVMHQLHDELLKLDGLISNSDGPSSSLVSSVEEDKEDDHWETVGPNNKSAVTRTQSFVTSKLSAIFGGQLRSVVKAKGSKASATEEPYLLLHLNVSPNPVSTIEDALKFFSAPETLEGYRTSTVGKSQAEVVNASKSVKILELSKVMVLHLMRFSYESDGSTKLNKPVHFPLELVLGRELLASNTEGGRRYELVGTITHHGRDPSKGHYTADARHSSGKWMRFDDASVMPISTSDVLHDQAYVLFYRQL